MASVNKVILVGNLGRDPEVRYSPDGGAICNVSIATTSSWKDKTSGEKREETEWHRVVFYNRLAEIVGEYVRKGMSIYVEGRIRTRKWQNKEGVDQYTTEIVADQMQMLGGRNEQQNLSAGHQAQSASRQSGQAADSPRQSNQAAESKQYSALHAGSLADMADDIPF